MLQLLGDEVPQTPYRGFAPGPHWGTSVPKTPFASSILEVWLRPCLLLNRKVDAVRRRSGGGHVPASARLRARAWKNVEYLLKFAVSVTAADSIPVTERLPHRYALVGRRTGHRSDAEPN
jgi:hypothetical protein